MANNDDMPEIPVETLAETENYTVWTSEEPDGETSFHIELGPVTAHFFDEEWDEFLDMIRAAADEEEAEVELDWGVLFFDADEWKELQALIKQLH
ncbi:MAG: hypothetical protein HY866_22770 [Chloroflexi bacterium]|nr:hypothetical protein [Chloroflexota bacterium]